MDWRPLHDEFEHWQNAGRHIPLWWRDDDVIEPTKPLDQLLDLAGIHGVAVHLAVIPAHAKDSLARRLEGNPCRVLTHGWTHENHAPADEKKAEYRDHRAAKVICRELKQGHAKITKMFGANFKPIFVPPWNRISPSVTDMLPDIGYTHVSTFNARKSAFEINTHIDPIDWRGSRSCTNPKTLIAQLVNVLQSRRANQSDPTEPLGYLTHHLVHDPAIWDFTNAFWTEMLKGPVTLNEIA